MNDALVQSILGFTLDARKTLEREADEQLQGIYGWLPDGAFTPANRMPALAQLPEATETRARLERFKDDEATAGVDAKAARKKLLREAAFTWLNRLVAFRMMEERRLLKKVISQLMTSPAYMFWLADEKDPEARKLHDAGEVPANPMGEGPRHVAYRRFLLWQCGELAQDVSILFDPGTLASRLCPRTPVLKQLVDAMNAENLVEAWQAGNEESIGWVYQAFNAEELQAAFAGAREQGRKFAPEDIPAVTQLFTIRWVVKFLVQNTLGRLWLEMHPDSRLKDKLDYYVPPTQEQKRPVKLAREITFLDPACGSMHFGLVAFDLFADIYREEFERAGEPGWAASASVSNHDEIPESIIEHNLHGIDIDLRAVQLSALTLLLRARTLNPLCAFTDKNLACANVEEMTAGRLEEFIKQAKFSHPIYERTLRTLATRLKDSSNLGSLLRMDHDVNELVAAERKKAEAENQFLIGFPGLSAEQFKTQAGIEEFFDLLTAQIERHLNEFVRATRQAGQDAGHFVSEAGKGVRFLSLVDQRYDVVATNPPYLSARKMNKRLATLMAEEYGEAKGDLYAAFIVRCQELLKDGGLMGMLTMHSFMFISSYEDMRAKLREHIAVQTMAHFGGGLFAVGNPGTLQTAAFVFEKRATKAECDAQEGVYFRLVREPDADTKRRAFEAALAAHTQAQSHPLLFRYLQLDFDAIPGKPWVYWITNGLRACFAAGHSVGDICSPVAGLRTSDNTRFLRFWWEVGVSKIDRRCRTRQDAQASVLKWFPYMKGGRSRRWHGNQEYVIDWWRDGAQITEAIMEAYPYLGRPWLGGNQDYFKEGVTWSDLTTGRFAARHSPGGFVFDVKGSCAFPSNVWVLMAVLNSKLAHVLLNMMNPTVSFQVGDIARLPLTRDRTNEIERLAKCAVDLARLDAAESEKSYDFTRPPIASSTPSKRTGEVGEIEGSLDDVMLAAYRLQPPDVALIDLETGETPSGDLEENESHEQEEDESGEDGSPSDWARSWISYAIGTVLGRFEIGKPGGLGCGDFRAATVTAIRALMDPDGIMPCDEGHSQDIAARAVKCLSLMLGDAEAREVIRTATDETSDPVQAVRGWLDRFTGTPDKSFWKYHFQLYRKRPVYWPLQSPRKKYTVWVFHEKFDKNTLFTVRNLVEERLRLLERKITDMRPAAANNRGVARDMDKLADMADDLREFSKRIKEITDRGYTPHIDDGVLLNAAPLHPLLPSWPETKAAWKELEAGDYDWAQQAMEYWPARVKAACQTNKSFAIAHGLA